MIYFITLYLSLIHIYMAKDGQSTDSLYYTYTPVTEEVPKEQIYQIRPYNSGLCIYRFEGCELRQKVARWETKGPKEIWQLCMEPGFQLSWSAQNPFYSLFIGQEGFVEDVYKRQGLHFG